jgi:hypothetical protein
MLEILAFGLIAGRYGVVYQFCLAMGLMRYLFVTTIIRMAALFAGIPLGFHLGGFEGAVIAIAASQFAGWPVAMYFKAQHGISDWKRELVGLPFFCVAAITGWGAMKLLT